MSLLLQFVIGLTFGSGLVLAGMTNPAKVAAMPTGGWDPSLALVLAGAIAVTFIGFKIVLRRKQPIFADTFHLPSAKELDVRIVAGPAIFGIGWGLAGFCPGPALTALSGGSVSAFQFVAAMLIGMGAARWAANRA